MSDDTERRLRESLRGANLPGSPETLRASMREIASSPAPVPEQRPWMRAVWALPALAAIVVVAVIAGAVSGGFGRLGPVAASSSPASAPASTAAIASPSEHPTPSATPLINAGVPVYTAAELQALLAADRASLVGQVVLVTGHVTPFIDSVCAVSDASTTCTAGYLADTNERVYVTGYTRRLEQSVAPNDPMTGTMAVKVLSAGLEPSNGLEYLGQMAYGANGVDFQADLSELRASWNAPSALTTFIVTGWLGTSGPMPCPWVPGSPPPADTPFGNGCPYTWLATADSAEPADAVPVQYTAYQDFAGTSNVAFPEPRYGTYLVRLVVDTRQGANGPVGWQVVARLAP